MLRHGSFQALTYGVAGWKVLGWADCGHLAAALDDLPE
jgi:hypothetical protein